MITYLISIKSSMENHSTFCRNVSIFEGIVKPKIPALFPPQATNFSLTMRQSYFTIFHITMNIPNALTLLRIIAIPVLVVILLIQFEGRELAALLVFVLAALTDMLDGFWARQKKQITVLGQLLDPIADKLLITSALICLVGLGTVPAWMAVIIIGREISVTGFRAIASSKKISIPASILGKIKMNTETITVALLILGKRYLGNLYFLSQIGLWLVIVTAVLSALEYFIKFGPKVLSKD